jgi:hypothetical protein
MHHVVYAVSPQRFDAATALFEELGFTFVTFELADLGLSVTLDWAGGVELISPLDTEAGRSSAVAQFWLRAAMACSQSLCELLTSQALRRWLPATAQS